MSPFWLRAVGATGSMTPSIEPLTTSSAAACCHSIGRRQRPRLRSPPGSGKSAGQLKSAMSKSPVSPPRAKQRLLRGTSANSKTLASFSSIRGVLSRTRKNYFASPLDDAGFSPRGELIRFALASLSDMRGERIEQKSAAAKRGSAAPVGSTPAPAANRALKIVTPRPHSNRSNR